MSRANSAPDLEPRGPFSCRRAATIIQPHTHIGKSASCPSLVTTHIRGTSVAFCLQITLITGIDAYREYGANWEPWISVKSKLLWNPNTANPQLSTPRKGSVDNPEQQMIKKSFLLALGKCHMLFATEQQNFLSSCVLLRLVLRCACISPHMPADSGGGKTGESVQKQGEWQGKPLPREEG